LDQILDHKQAAQTGWRGYALDRLQAHYSPLVASLILGVIWWELHLPLVFVQGSFLQGNGASPSFMAGYLGTVILYSTLFTWVCNHNGGNSMKGLFMAQFNARMYDAWIVTANRFGDENG
jgi:hypothetical protein